MTKNKDHFADPTTMPSSEVWNERYAAKELVWTAQPNRFVAEETANLPPGWALDLAAGEGRNAIWLAQQGWRVRAVDFSDVAIDKSHQLATAQGVAERIEFEVADLREYDPGKDAFDLVMMIYLQLPQTALAPLIERAASAVAPEGIFLLVAHDSSNLEHGYGGPQNPDVLYTAEQVTPLLVDRFEIEKAGVVQRPVDTDSGARVALDCLVRARRRV